MATGVFATTKGKVMALLLLGVLVVTSANAKGPRALDSEQISTYFSFVSAYDFTPHRECFSSPSLFCTIKKPTRQEFGYDKLRIIDLDVENNRLRVQYSLEGRDMGELDFVIEQVIWDPNRNENPRLRMVFSEAESAHTAIGGIGIRQDKKVVYHLTIDLISQIAYLEQDYHATHTNQWNPLLISRLNGKIKFKTNIPPTVVQKHSCQVHLLY